MRVLKLLSSLKCFPILMNLVTMMVRSLILGAHRIKLPTQKDKWFARDIIAKICGALK